MSSAALRASDTADTQSDGAKRKLNASLIVTMNGQTGRMTAGTGDLVKLDAINDRIIKGLRNMLAIMDKNGYHSIVNRDGFIHVCGEWRTRLSQGAGPLFFCYKPMITQKVQHKSI